MLTACCIDSLAVNKSRGKARCTTVGDILG